MADPGPAPGDESVLDHPRVWPLEGGYSVAVHDARLGADPAPVLDLWERHDVHAPAVRRQRAGEIVALARAPGGSVVGVSTTVVVHAPRPGAMLWRYRTWVAPEHRRSAVAFGLSAIGFEHLGARFAAGHDRHAPGVLAEIENPSVVGRWPQADWYPLGLVYLGRTPRGIPVRVHYFPGAAAPAPRPLASVELPDGHRVAPLAGHPTVRPDDVVALWTRHGALSSAAARERLVDVLLVATAPEGEPVAVATAALAVQPQLHLPVWNYRTWVAPGHRVGGLALQMAASCAVHLESRWTSGVDRRGCAVVFEIENAGLRRHFADAVWPRTQMAYVGEWDGVDVRVRYFPGAEAPLPA